MKTTTKDILRFKELTKDEDKELVIFYPTSLKVFAYLVELSKFYGIKKFRLKDSKKVVYLNRDIDEDNLIIKEKTFINGNILKNCTLIIANKVFIKGLIFGKVIFIKEGLLKKI